MSCITNPDAQMQVCELEKQIGHGRRRGPDMTGSALLTQEAASRRLPFIRHISEQQVWQSDVRASADMQRQRSQSDPTVPSHLQRLSPVGREWEQLQEDHSRLRRQDSPFGQPLRASQAPESLVGSTIAPGGESSGSSDSGQSQPDAVKKVCSDGPTSHVTGIRTDQQAEPAVNLQSAGAVLQHQQQHMHTPEQPTVQMSKDVSGTEPAVQALQAGKVAPQPASSRCTKEAASSPAEESTAHGPGAEYRRLSVQESGSSSGKATGASLVTGDGTAQIKPQETGTAAGLHQHEVLEQQCGAVPGCSESQGHGMSAKAVDTEAADVGVVPSGPGAGLGRRSKPFAYGPRTLPTGKVAAGSGVYGIAANGSAASTLNRHVQPDADQPAIGSIGPPRKPFAYGPRGLFLFMTGQREYPASQR